MSPKRPKHSGKLVDFLACAFIGVDTVQVATTHIAIVHVDPHRSGSQLRPVAQAARLSIRCVTITAYFVHEAVVIIEETDVTIHNVHKSAVLWSSVDPNAGEANDIAFPHMYPEAMLDPQSPFLIYKSSLFRMKTIISNIKSSLFNEKPSYL